MNRTKPTPSARPAFAAFHRRGGHRAVNPINLPPLATVLGLAALCGSASTAPCAGAETAPAPGAIPFKKPAWLTDLSVSVKEGYDDNVFVSGVDSNFLPNTYTVPAGSVAALKNQSSWVTTIAPKLGVNFAPLLGLKPLEALTIGYAPDFAIYHNETSESFNAHRLAATVKGKAENFSFNLENAFNYIDGSSFGPTFPGGLLSAYATAAARERREQMQDRAKVVLRYDQPKWFVRPTASLLYYDLKTTQLNVAGYQNYADRYDVNGGADFGYKISPKFAVTLGYRYGHQYQEQYSFALQSAPSDYHRALVGVEAKPWKWLKLEVQGGPDFRTYAENTPTHITPVNDFTPVKYYGEATIAAEISTKDTLTFKYRQFQWVSSTGRIPYFDSLYDLSYRRKMTSKLTVDLGARLATSDYTSANLTPNNLRDDWQYTFTVGAAYSVTPNLVVSGTYGVDLGRNAQDRITNPQTREFTHQVVSLGATFKF
jgi:hypothetical protein